MSEPSPIILSAPDAGNRSAGEALRLAREAQGLTLEALAGIIKVAPAKLAALEQAQYDRLPDANFTRALAMTVCRALKLDPAGVLPGLPVARPTELATGKPPLNQPFKEARGGAPLFDHHLDWSAALRMKWLAPAALLLAAAAVYLMPESSQWPDWAKGLVPVAPASVQGAASTPAVEVGVPLGAGVDLAAPGAASVPTEAVPPASAPVASAALTPAATLVLDAASQAVTPASVASVAAPPSQPLSPAAAPGLSDVSFSATQSAWIEVRDAQGEKLLAKLLTSGEVASVTGSPPMRVRIGNAAGVQLNYRGQPVDLQTYTRNNVARVELK